ncbi:pentapeptide repeat-containing protein [Rhizobium sp. Root482]|uniref:pentapeptide repeat-containing protein n=1 Tax=Rhizobium sp. Root482 TaxID=1736543 RepID=UPI001FCCF8D2|nr:pentapeptide repeat-containing protein [Rhizobium sp. Root482]
MSRIASMQAKVARKGISNVLAGGHAKVRDATRPLCAALFLALAFVGAPAAAADCGGMPGPGLDWRDCSKKNLLLQSSVLQGANLAGADFSMTDLGHSDLSTANLEKTNLMRASLRGAKAEKASFAKAEAYRADFTGLAAAGASFAGAELQRADFTGADLTGTDFEKAEAGRANFDKAVLTGARFALANLSRAHLSNASFEGPLDFDRAFLFLTRIEGLDLSQAKGLEQAQIDIACGDDKTKLPAGLKTPPDWPCAPE